MRAQTLTYLASVETELLLDPIPLPKPWRGAVGELAATLPYYDPDRNPDCRFVHASKRSFHREHNFALILTLLDSACCIGEVCSLKLGDFQQAESKHGPYWQITIQESKGRTARTVPLSKHGAEAIHSWLKTRVRVMSNVPKDEDPGYLFLSEIGGRVDEGQVLDIIKRYLEFAGLGNRITLHSLRRYSLNRLAKTNLTAAQDIAGHKDTKTTLIYTKIDPDFVREMHEQVGVVRGILGSKRAEKQRRLALG